MVNELDKCGVNKMSSTVKEFLKACLKTNEMLNTRNTRKLLILSGLTFPAIDENAMF